MLYGLCAQYVLILYIYLWLIFHKEKRQEFIGRGRYMKHTKTLLIIYRAERKRSPSGQTVPFSMKWGDDLNLCVCVPLSAFIFWYLILIGLESFR